MLHDRTAAIAGHKGLCNQVCEGDPLRTCGLSVPPFEQNSNVPIVLQEMFRYHILTGMT